MNRPIESARDSDLRLSQAAMQRAAQRARELAAQTGTALIVSEDGVIKQLYPKADAVPPTVQAPIAPYRDEP